MNTFKMMGILFWSAPILSVVLLPSPVSAFTATSARQYRQYHSRLSHNNLMVVLHSTTTSFFGGGSGSGSDTIVLGPHMPINNDYPGLKRVHQNPDIFIIENFLQEDACRDMMERAERKGDMARSPVAYAGWTQDFQDLIELAAKGPVAWAALITAWFQVKDSTASSQIELVIHALQNYVGILIISAAAIAYFTKSRADGLQDLRTSTSTTLNDISDHESGPSQFVRNTAELFSSEDDHSTSFSSLRNEAAKFEAPTVIRYEADQKLAPHYDANRSADVEDANRGGQTLATLLVYLNNVPNGGLTRFGKLQGYSDINNNDDCLTVQPKQGDALLFFPADARGQFDERMEHEGCPAVDEKWIARIWRHQSRVPPPFGLAEDALSALI